MTRLLVAVAAVGSALWCTVGTASAAPPLELRRLDASVVRVGTLHGEPLFGVRLRTYVRAVDNDLYWVVGPCWTPRRSPQHDARSFSAGGSVRAADQAAE